MFGRMVRERVCGGGGGEVSPCQPPSSHPPERGERRAEDGRAAERGERGGRGMTGRESAGQGAGDEKGEGTGGEGCNQVFPSQPYWSLAVS